MKDYYYILGVSHKASIADIKKAFRLLSKKFHPDVNSGDKYFEERFKDIIEAYETLVDDVKRRKYDELRNSNFSVNDLKRKYEEFYEEKEKFNKEKEEVREALQKEWEKRREAKNKSSEKENVNKSNTKVSNRQLSKKRVAILIGAGLILIATIFIYSRVIKRVRLDTSKIPSTERPNISTTNYVRDGETVFFWSECDEFYYHKYSLCKKINGCKQIEIDWRTADLWDLMTHQCVKEK